MQRRLGSSDIKFLHHVEALWGDLIKDYDSVPNSDNWNGITSLELELVDHLDTSGMCIDERVRIGDRIVKLDKHTEVGLI